MSVQKTPFKVHVVVCQNTRPDRPEILSCGGVISKEIAIELKNFVDEVKLKGKVRISTTKCLGQCDLGPNVMIYPQEVWFSHCNLESIDDIKAKILELSQ